MNLQLRGVKSCWYVKGVQDFESEACWGVKLLANKSITDPGSVFQKDDQDQAVICSELF